LCEEEAATAVEYAVLLALILVAVITAVTSVGSSTSTVWSNVDTRTANAGLGK
jgi:pilus assembly protein Flp/PilA